MLTGPEVNSGQQEQVKQPLDHAEAAKGDSKFPLIAALNNLTPYIPLNVLGIKEYRLGQREVAQGMTTPIEVGVYTRNLGDFLRILARAGFKIKLEKPEQRWLTEVRRDQQEADLGIVTNGSLPYLQTTRDSSEKPAFQQGVKPPHHRSLSETAFRIAAVAGIVTTGMYISEGLLAKAEVIKDAYGPEITRAELEAHPLNITATDYVNDAKGNVIKQRVVVGNKLYESVFNEATGTFGNDFHLVSVLPIGHVTSLISSSDDKTLIAGGELEIRSGMTALAYSKDGGRTWTSFWPKEYGASGPTVNLVPLNDQEFFGNNGVFEEAPVPQFTVKINPVTGEASVQATNLTVQATSLNIGSALDLRVASIEGSKVRMYSAGSLDLSLGFLEIDLDAQTNIGTAKQITQTLIGGELINLGWLAGINIYNDTAGSLRLQGSNYMRQIIYDINPLDSLDGTSTQFNYANLLDGKGIPNYIPGSLNIMALNSYLNATSNRVTMLAGSYGSTVDGIGRAIVVNEDTLNYYDLSPNNISGIDQGSFIRQKINGTYGYTVNIRNFGVAFIPDKGTPVYIGRGVDRLFKIFLPLTLKGASNN